MRRVQGTSCVIQKSEGKDKCMVGKYLNLIDNDRKEKILRIGKIN